MRKNIDKWNHYLGILENEANEFIDNLGRDIPGTIYKVDHTGEITECIVRKLRYRFSEHDIDVYFRGERPTREKVKAIKEASERDIDYRWENIAIHYKYEWGEGRTASSMIGYGKLLRSDKFFIEKDNAIQESERIKAEKKKEEELLNNGHIKCHYCSDIIPEEEAVEKTMISRMYDNLKKRFKFCSDKCATHNQMSLEG